MGQASVPALHSKDEHRTAGAARLPPAVGPGGEHEVIEDPLAASLEQVEQARLAFWTLEDRLHRVVYFPLLRRNIMPAFDRISLDPDVMGGKPCIRGIRVTVGTVLGLLASGHTEEEILKAYPYLEKEDIRAALTYATLV
jgi:uncharacterized protein (DUF433 family)